MHVRLVSALGEDAVSGSNDTAGVGVLTLNDRHMNASVRCRVIRPSNEVPDDRRRPSESVGLSPAPHRATDAASDTSVAYLNCPRCGLSIARSSRWAAITHCPRCAGRGRTIVALFSSRLPADLLYADGSLPHANAVADASRRQRLWRVKTRPTTTPASVQLIRSLTLGGRQ